MNIEELKLIIQAVMQLGESGKEAFIWWLLLDQIPSLIVFIAFIVAAYKVLSPLTRASESKLKEIRSATVGGAYHYDEDDHVQVMEWIRKAKGIEK